MKNLLTAFFLALLFMLCSSLVHSITEPQEGKKALKIQRDLNRAKSVYCGKDADKKARKVAYSFIKKTFPLLPKNWICT